MDCSNGVQLSEDAYNVVDDADKKGSRATKTYND